MNRGVTKGLRLTVVLTVLAVLVAGLVWGLTGALAESESPAPAADGKTTLRLGWTADPDSLNPFIGWDSSSYEVWSLNYDLLVGFRASDLTNQPGIGLATDWETSDDGKVWTFTIVDGATWQDGEPVTASDVAFTFNYVIDNEMGRNGTDPNQFDFWNDGSGGNNCYSGNTTSTKAPSPGAIPPVATLNELYPECPVAPGSQPNNGATGTSDGEINMVLELVGYSSTNPPENQQCSWDMHSHPAFKDYEPLEVTPGPTCP